MVKTGLEVLIEERLDLVHGKRVGLITNPTGVDRRLRPAPDLLHETGVNLVALFGPEHGIRGNVADGVPIDSTVDSQLGIPVHSLYGATKKPTPEMLEGVDLLIFDTQGVGARFTTGTSVMSLAMEAAGEKGIPFVVLDRPNPLGGEKTEGPVLEPEMASFIGRFPVPNRTGMTRGELAGIFVGEFGLKCDLTVVKMTGWKRSMWFDETGLPWVMMSPNMPTLDTAIVYSGTCPFEGTWCSEGRGMTRPFETIGAPWLDNRLIADEMNALGLPGVLFRATWFTPTTSKHKDVPCGGVQLHVTDRDAFQPVRAGLHLLSAIRRLHPNAFEWRTWSPGVYSIDRLWGTSKIRLSLEAGVEPEEIIASWQPDLAKYDAMRAKYFLYD